MSCVPSFPRRAGSVTDILWTDVRVGDVIVVRDGELFPADLMCLYSSLPENVCFIKTTNLDGETNLKIRKPLDLKGLPVRTLQCFLLLPRSALRSFECCACMASLCYSTGHRCH